MIAAAPVLLDFYGRHRIVSPEVKQVDYSKMPTNPGLGQ